MATPFERSDSSPWHLEKRLVPYQNPWTEVWEDHLISATNREQRGLYGYFAPKDYAIVCAIDADDQVMLVRQWRQAYGCHSWELPCGSLEPNETPLAGAQRELAEETGLQADHWHHFAPFHASDARVAGVGHAFLAHDLRLMSEAPASDHTELDLICARVPFPEAIAACRDGHITNITSVAVILRVEDFRREQLAP